MCTRRSHCAGRRSTADARIVDPDLAVGIASDMERFAEPTDAPVCQTHPQRAGTGGIEPLVAVDRAHTPSPDRFGSLRRTAAGPLKRWRDKAECTQPRQPGVKNALVTRFDIATILTRWGTGG
jgi:hypothetical protein